MARKKKGQPIVVREASVEIAEVQPMTTAQVVDLWLASRPSPGTRKTYQEALDDFAKSVGMVDVLFQSPQHANTAASAFKAKMLARKLFPSTINNRLSAIRSLVDYVATELGYISWRLVVHNLKEKKYRDTKGPGVEGVRKLRDAATIRAGVRRPSAERDVALISLMSGLGLRRASVINLDMADVDLDAGVLLVQSKGGGGQKEPKSMPAGVREDVAAWIRQRGDKPGPLFMGKDDKRMSLDVASKIILRLGARAKVKGARCHGLRHTAITRVIETIKDLRAAQQFSGHADLNTLVRYDDNLQDRGGDAAKAIDGDFHRDQLDFYVLLVQKGKRPKWKTASKVSGWGIHDAVKTWVMESDEIVWEDGGEVKVLASANESGKPATRFTVSLYIRYECIVNTTK